MFLKYLKYLVISVWMVLALISGYLTIASNFNFEGMIQTLAQSLSSVKSSSWSWSLPLLFVAIFIARPLLLIPTFVMNLVAFALFGPFEGFVWVLLAEQCSALTFYLSVKYLVGESTKDGFRQFTRRMRIDVNDDPKKHFYLVLVLRLASLPFDFVTAGCALGGIKIPPFMLATGLVSIPWVALFFLILTSLSSGSVAKTVVNTLIFITFLLLGGYVARRSGLILPSPQKVENE